MAFADKEKVTVIATVNVQMALFVNLMDGGEQIIAELVRLKLESIKS